MKQIGIGTYEYQATQGELITLDAPEGSIVAIDGLHLHPVRSSATRDSFTFNMPAGRAVVGASFALIPNPQDSYLNISGSQDPSSQYSINVKPFESIFLSFETDYPGPR